MPSPSICSAICWRWNPGDDQQTACLARKVYSVVLVYENHYADVLSFNEPVDRWAHVVHAQCCIGDGFPTSRRRVAGHEYHNVDRICLQCAVSLAVSVGEITGQLMDGGIGEPWIDRQRSEDDAVT